MKREDEEKTCFITTFGTYCFVRMPEGLKNVEPTFCRITKAIFEQQLGRNIFTYFDDVVVESKEKNSHISDLAETFGRMRESKLKLNPENAFSEYRRERCWDAWCPSKE